MRPKQIILFRHGQSDANLSKTVLEKTPDYLIGLTKLGEEQCATLGQNLKPYVDGKTLTVWSSPYKRSRQTSSIVVEQFSNSNITFKEDPRIREQEWGNFLTQDIFDNEVSKRQEYGRFFYRIKDGESGTDVYDRLSTFLESLYRDFERYPNQDVVLISSHGMTLLIFLKRFFRWTYEKYTEENTFKNCGYVVLSLDTKNNRYHLSDDFRQGF